MTHYFEFGDWIPVTQPVTLQSYLSHLYQQQKTDASFDLMLDSEDASTKQPFLQFDGSSARANNYTGFIQHDGQLIEIYPKVFRASRCEDKVLMLRHLFYWMDFCRKWRFPFSTALLSEQVAENFPEMIIHLMIKQIHGTISSQPYCQYTPVEEALSYPRGTINFNRYVRNGLSRGRGFMIECDYEPFAFDNAMNRLIKFCVRKLSTQTTLRENFYLIDQCIQCLDEVEDTMVSMKTAETIRINAFMSGYTDILETCKIILRNQLYDNASYDSKQWCLLLPMEEIFEDFVAGFLEHYFSPEWTVEYQKSDAYVSDEPRVFNMQHDIFLTKGSRKIIFDTKYKIRDAQFKKDPKKGVSQTDLYQVLSYAFKRGCTEVCLIYPNVDETLQSKDVFRIRSPFSTSDITVTALEIPFWSINKLEDLEKRLLRFLRTFLNCKEEDVA